MGMKVRAVTPYHMTQATCTLFKGYHMLVYHELILLTILMFLAFQNKDTVKHEPARQMR